MMFGDDRSPLGVSRTVDRVFGSRLPCQRGIGAGRLGRSSSEERAVLPGPAAARIGHSDWKILTAAVGKKADPRLPTLVVTHQRDGRGRRLVAASRRLRG